MSYATIVFQLDAANPVYLVCQHFLWYLQVPQDDVGWTRTITKS